MGRELEEYQEYALSQNGMVRLLAVLEPHFLHARHSACAREFGALYVPFEGFCRVLIPSFPTQNQPVSSAPGQRQSRRPSGMICGSLGVKLAGNDV